MILQATALVVTSVEPDFHQASEFGIQLCGGYSLSSAATFFFRPFVVFLGFSGGVQLRMSSNVTSSDLAPSFSLAVLVDLFQNSIILLRPRIR